MKPSPQRNWHPESAPRRRAGIWGEDHEDDAIKMGMRVSMTWDTIFWDLFHQQGQQGEPGCRHLLQPGRDQISSEVTTLWEKKSQKVKNIWADLYCSSAWPPTLDWCSSAQYLSNVHLYHSLSLRHQRAVQNLSNVHLYQGSPKGSSHVQTALSPYAPLCITTELPPHTVLKKSNLSPRYLYLSWEAI